MSTQPEFSGAKGRFFAWFLTSPLRRILEWKMGNPDPRFMDLLELEGHETVVDSGCGSGHHTLMVADRLPRGRVVGLDVSREMLDKLGRNAVRRGLQDRVEAIEADALAIPLDDGMADRAITLAAWHHLADPQAACSELARVLRSGGRLVAVDLEISAHHQPGKHLEGHDRTFGGSDMRRILETAGLQDIAIETVGRWVIGSALK